MYIYMYIAKSNKHFKHDNMMATPCSENIGITSTVLKCLAAMPSPVITSAIPSLFHIPSLTLVIPARYLYLV